jgi:uncharacterized protein (DUF2267 family)
MALRGVLHALGDLLTPDETAELAARLPTLIRGFFYEGWHPATKPLKYRHTLLVARYANDRVTGNQGVVFGCRYH